MSADFVMLFFLVGAHTTLLVDLTKHKSRRCIIAIAIAAQAGALRGFYLLNRTARTMAEGRFWVIVVSTMLVASKLTAWHTSVMEDAGYYQ
jgi:hypothetical protein